MEIRFHGELGELVAPADRGRRVRREVAVGTTVKDLVESLGVPHTEVDVIVVNGASVGFGHRLAPGDQVEVFPVSEAVDVTPIVHLRPEPPRTPRFVLDVHLGRLARDLRLLGFDALWGNEASHVELARTSSDQQRILLSRDRGLLKRRAVTQGYYVRGTSHRAQLDEVVQRFGLRGRIEPFGRCLACNGLLQLVSKVDVEQLLPPRTRRDYDEFRRCPDCGRVYWKGSHYDALRRVVDAVRRSDPVERGATGDRRRHP